MNTVEWKHNKVRIIDQTKLPLKLVYSDLSSAKAVWWAIKRLKVRGAPAIGITAALGAYLGMRSSKAKTYAQFVNNFKKVRRYLNKTRPTAVNLFWALERMESVIKRSANKNIPHLKKLLLNEALKILDEDKLICRKMAGYGASLVKKGDTILTHCNAGALATADYGTALGVIYEANKQGKGVKAFADETRPILQGARLTAWELLHHGVDVTLICDNMAADVIRDGKIDKIFVGADRIASNGDTANKIGTYNLAVLACFHRIPFYVVAPSSSFDLSLSSGALIPIEQRGADEVRKVFGKQVAPKNVKVYNPAFDVTPNELISAIVTEWGILRKPYRKSIKRLTKLGCGSE